MELRQLEIFRALAEELNFTRAAERVHCVQSNVTAQIRSLEEELGVRLFERLARRVVLTDAGHRLLPYANRVLTTVAEARAAVGHAEEPSGPLLVGSPESVLTYRLPRVLSWFRRKYPKVNLLFRPYYNDRLDEQLEHGALDVAIQMLDRFDSERLRAKQLRMERIMFFSSPNHPLAKRARIDAESFRGQALLLTESGCSYRAKLDRLLDLKKIAPVSITEFNSVEAIKECSALGMGIGLLPEIVIHKELQRKVLVALPWDGPAMDMNTFIVWHRDKWMSSALKAFLNAMEELGAEPIEVLAG